MIQEITIIHISKRIMAISRNYNMNKLSKEQIKLKLITI